MNSQDAIQKELKDLRSSLPFDDREQPVFTVPEGYFENFAASVSAKVKSQETSGVTDELHALSPVLAAIPKRTPFNVPENYFNNLATGLPALVNEAALPDFLQTHTKQMPYHVPSRYFETLATQVLAKVEKPQAKVVSISSRFMRYAAAALVAGAIAVGGIFYAIGNSAGIDPTKQPGVWVAQKLKNVPNRDLEAFLSTTGTGFSSKELAQKGGKAEVRTMLTDVSTTELDAFLSELPAEADFSNIN